MKVLRMSVLVWMVLFLMLGVCLAQSVEEYYNKGVKYGAQGKFKEAQEELKKSLVLNPFFTPARHCLQLSEDIFKEKAKKDVVISLFEGLSYGNEGMLDEAISMFKKAIVIDPDYDPSYVNLGQAYLIKGILDEAIVTFRKAILINPNNTEARTNLGVTYNDKGMFDEAIAEYKNTIAIDPNFAEAYTNLGVSYYKKRMFDDAIAAYKKALTFYPNDGMTNYNLALSYYYAKQYKLAVEYYDKAVKVGYEVHPGFLEELKPYRN